MRPHIFHILSVFFLFATTAFACDEISGMPDWNCDGKISITVAGDSFVYGVGDTKNSSSGGYILRARESLPHFEILNQGVSGLTATALHSRISRAFRGESLPELKSDLLNADVVVLDLGRNDRWSFGLPKDTHKKLLTIAATIKRKVLAEGHVAPVVVIANLMLPNRGSQGPWVKELNTYILKGNTVRIPADLRFDLVSKRLLSADQIHPTSKGYDALAKVFVKYVSRTLPKKLRALQAL